MKEDIWIADWKSARNLKPVKGLATACRMQKLRERVSHKAVCALSL